MLNNSVQYLKGIGVKRAKTLNKIGIATIEDLLYYFPHRYEDRANFSPISALKEGEFQSIKASVLARGERRSWRRSGFRVLEIAVGDESGKIFCVWFNQGYLKDYFKVGSTLILYGKIERFGARLQMNSPEFELVGADNDESLNIGRITPIYSAPAGISQRYLRKIIKHALDEHLPKLEDFLPYDVRSRNNLLNLAKSLLQIHFPDDIDAKNEAYRRLAFDEFFLFQLPLILRKLKKKEKQGIAHRIEGALVKDFVSGLPFKLTQAQEKAIEEISSDMGKPQVMQRLLQGDVGSGKTVVATIASLFALQGGYQVAFMVPTEILARQHYLVVSSQLPPSKAGPPAAEVVSKDIKIALLTSSLNKKEKESICREIKEGKINLVIGTHALLEENVEFQKLGLVVIDEQHKFGVGQRALLPRKGATPDVLIMTATPIPRTLAITLYGDLDISIINELPPGRLPVKTTHFSQAQRLKAYEELKAQLKLKNQAYIIYPVIDDSYALDIEGAKKMYERLKNGQLKDFKLGLIHGRMEQGEQNKIMLKFKDRELDILVATTVLEVGIDVPTVTCILIENAERFGLAQLHQLRGRVGRSDRASFCLLISDVKTQEAKMRLEAMVKYSDGFRIAEEDLKIRGPGEFFGSRQHGLTELKIGNPLTQMQLLKKAREEAIRVVISDPRLDLRPNLPLKGKLLQRFPEYEKLMIVG